MTYGLWNAGTKAAVKAAQKHIVGGGKLAKP
jgi:hypothetical protein